VSVPRPVRLSPLDLLGLGFLGIRTRKMRAALSALGIAIGIATMVVVTGIPASSQKALLQQLSSLGTDMLRAGVAATSDDTGDPAFPVESTSMVARISPVRSVAAVANLHLPVRRSDRTEAGDGAGLTPLAATPNLLTLLRGHLSSGRYLDATSSRLPMTVLGAQTASRLGIPRVNPGERPAQVLIGRQWYTVVGILDPVRLSPDLDTSVLVGWPSAVSYLKFDSRPTVLYVRSYEPAVEQVRSVLPATISPNQPGQVQVSRPSDALAAKRATESTYSALFLGLAGVALLVGGVGVANTMVISVLERRSEIGLRRALGAHRGQIRTQFLAESVALSTLGGLAGTVLGLAATAGYAYWQHWPVVVPLTAIGVGIGGAAVIGVVAGVYPSMRAARLTPNEALAT
jgi:putative ABC transport system permease protein